jgi:hypothetical protein
MAVAQLRHRLHDEVLALPALDVADDADDGRVRRDAELAADRGAAAGREALAVVPSYTVRYRRALTRRALAVELVIPTNVSIQRDMTRSRGPMRR